MRVSLLVRATERNNPLVFIALMLATTLMPVKFGHAAAKSWNKGNGTWGSASNWTPGGVPAAGDAALVGTLAAAHDAVVAVSSDSLVGSLTIVDGMTVRTWNSSLEVTGTTQVGGQNIVGPTTYASRMRIQNGALGTDFTTGNLSLTDFGQTTLENGASMLVLGTATLGQDTLLGGTGAVYFSKVGGSALVNDGRIEATAGGLTLYQTSSGRFDLDGLAGNGLIIVDSGNGNGLAVSGDQLTDAFDGDIEMGSDSVLNVSMSNGWTAGSSSSLVVTGTGDLPTSVVDGSHLTWAGDLTVTGDRGRLLFDSEVTLQPATVVNVHDEDKLEFSAATVVNGGDYILATGAQLLFSGGTTIAGGTFSTSGVAANSGMVSFSGPIDWQGDVTLSGRSRVSGTAVVSATTTIDADQFDMDGVGGSTSWDVNAPLTINADQIDSTNNFFDGSFAIGGGLFPKLTVNLADPNDAWQMMGTMDLSSIPGFYLNRVTGSRMEVGGTINIANSDVVISAPIALLNGSDVNFAAPTSDLRLDAASTIAAGAGFSGQGLLHNNTQGDGMKIANGATLGQVGLANEGHLSIGNDAPGQVSVDRFTSENDATLQVFVGGTTPGTELSNLLVTGGTAQLDGTLEISLFDDGGGFVPALGDQFAIVTAPGGVIDDFDHLVQPLGLPTGLLFEVQYTATNVILLVGETYEADFNRDGIVNQTDLAIWNDAYGVNNHADANSDGISDAADFLIWQQQLGFGQISITAVPEPATILMTCLGLLTVGGVRRRGFQTRPRNRSESRCEPAVRPSPVSTARPAS